MHNVNLSFKAAEALPKTSMPVQQSNNNNNPAESSANGTKSLLLGLTALASAAIAGIALYKNHGMQNELNRTIKKLDEAQAELKKVVNDTENKIKNAVDDALKTTKPEPAVEVKPPTKAMTENVQTPPVQKTKRQRNNGNYNYQPNTQNKPLYDEKLAKEGEAIIEAEEAAARKAKKASDRRNQEWVEKQHKIKEQEYSDFMNKAMSEKETKEGLAIIEAEEAAARKAQKASDRRNQEWVEKQHKIKEQEYNKWFYENNEAFDAIEETVDSELKIKADNVLRRQEIEETFAQHPIRASYLNAKASVRHFYKSKLENPINQTTSNIKAKFSKLKNIFSRKTD